MRRGTLGRWAIVGATTALAGGCGLLVGFPDRTLGSGEGGGGASASSSGMGGDSSNVSSGGGGDGGHGGAPTTVTSTGSASSSSAGSSTSTGVVQTYCDTVVPAPLFCDDFEDNSLAKWKVQAPTDGKVAVSTAQVLPGSSHSLEVRLFGGGAVSTNYGQVVKSFPASYASMHLGFDMYVDKFASPDTTYVAAVDVGADLSALLYILPGGTKIQQKLPGSNFGNDIDAMLGLTLHQWMHVDIDLKLVTGGTSTVTLKIDSTTVLDAKPLKSEWTTGQPTVRLGLPILNDTGDRAVYYDNVVFKAP
ncbi:MAG: hypothetical protein ACMG6S_30720 [Byssovorax sp.]